MTRRAYSTSYPNITTQSTLTSILRLGTVLLEIVNPVPEIVHNEHLRLYLPLLRGQPRLHLLVLALGGAAAATHRGQVLPLLLQFVLQNRVTNTIPSFQA